MEKSAALNVATGGCLYLDTPDGRKDVPAHLLLPEVQAQYGIHTDWIVDTDTEKVGCTPFTEAQCWEPSFEEIDEGDLSFDTDPESCICTEWMAEATMEGW